MLVAVVLVGAGLGVRHSPSLFPRFIADYLPDTAWASLVYVLIALMGPGRRPVRVGLVAITVAFGIELSQLYHAEWIDAIRQTRLGGLLLGYGFLWSDLVCYTAGVAVSALVDQGIGSKTSWKNWEGRCGSHDSGDF